MKINKKTKNKITILIFSLQIFLSLFYCCSAKQIKLEKPKEEKYCKVFSGQIGEEKCRVNAFFENSEDEKKEIDDDVKNLVVFYLLNSTPSLSLNTRKKIAAFNEFNEADSNALYLEKGESKKIEQFLKEKNFKNLRKKKNINLNSLINQVISLIEKKIEDLEKEKNTLKKISDNDTNYFINFEKEKIKRETNNTEKNLISYLKDKDLFKNKEKLEKDGRKSVKEKIEENEKKINNYKNKIIKIKNIEKKDFIYALKNIIFCIPLIENKKDNFCSNIIFEIKEPNSEVFIKNLYLTWLKFIFIKYMIKKQVIYNENSDIYTHSSNADLIYYHKSLDNIIFFLDSRENLEKIEKNFRSADFKKFKEEYFNEKNFNIFIKHFLKDMYKRKKSSEKEIYNLENIPPIEIEKSELNKRISGCKDDLDNLKKENEEINKDSILRLEKQIEETKELLKDEKKLEELAKKNCDSQKKEKNKQLKILEKTIKNLEKIKLKDMLRIEAMFKLKNIIIYYKG